MDIKMYKATIITLEEIVKFYDSSVEDVLTVLIDEEFEKLFILDKVKK